MKTGVYPGSFDPFTMGHLDVLSAACGLFDRVIVAVLKNSQKQSVFALSEKTEMIQRAIASHGLSERAEVAGFGGLIVDFARQVGADHIIRGLRAVTDFEYEFQIDAVNRHLAGDVHTVYFMASPERSFLSSSSIKEIGAYGGSIKGLVPSCNEELILERLGKKL